MPYYAIRRDDTSIGESTPASTCESAGYTAHDTPQAALAAVTARGDKPGDYRVTFRATSEQRNDWHTREESRFAGGTYQRTPWSGGRYSTYYEHFAHLSRTNPGQIAYTKNDEHGIADRQTIMRPGRYLEQFYSDYSKEQRDEWTAQCAAGFLDLHIARTADDIETVYVGSVTSSCMTHRAPDSDMRCTHTDHKDESEKAASRCRKYESSVHPVRVYGDSDLGVAYFGPIDRVRARAVVWPDRMIYSRIYGDTCKLEAMLRTAGYSSGKLTGARIRRHDEDNDNVLMPYIDWNGCAREDNLSTRYLVIDPNGSIETQSTDGLAQLCEQTACCDHCEREYPQSEIEEHGGYCESCDNDRTCCDSCNENTWDATRTERGRYLCEDCARDEHTECCIPDCYTEWHAGDFSRSEQRERRAHHTEQMCRDCATRYQVCVECDETFDRTEPICPHCDHTVRCDHTADLLAPIQPEENS